jgi:hypothetical protein
MRVSSGSRVWVLLGSIAVSSYGFVGCGDDGGDDDDDSPGVAGGGRGGSSAAGQGGRAESRGGAGRNSAGAGGAVAGSTAGGAGGSDPSAGNGGAAQAGAPGEAGSRGRSVVLVSAARARRLVFAPRSLRFSTRGRARLRAGARSAIRAREREHVGGVVRGFGERTAGDAGEQRDAHRQAERRLEVIAIVDVAIAGRCVKPDRPSAVNPTE